MSRGTSSRAPGRNPHVLVQAFDSYDFWTAQKTGNVRENLTRQRLTERPLGLFTKLSTEALDK
jgi:hypothetical protein